jgi:methylenetetrahydrofolate dehydrogenase (NADP+)/methenyltetrahydrofolate cyclohydrolase
MSDSMPSDFADKLMDGRPLARRMLAAAADKVQTIYDRTGVRACLATVIVGEDPSSRVYVKMKRRQCDAAGMKSIVIELPLGTSTDALLVAVRRLAEDPGVHGILLQHPVPAPIDRRAAFEAIPTHKDVDGVTSATLGRMILELPSFVPCTPSGIMTLLREYDVEFDGAHAVVIGRSPILGRPMASLLINAHATVTLCHSRTRRLPEIVEQADILIAAVGRRNFVQGIWIKPGAVVVDAGYNEGNVGDVDFEAALERCSLITPVPGGVGPMTIATLIDHTADAAAAAAGLA